MNNYCLRRLRYAMNLDNQALIKLFANIGYKLELNELKPFLLKEEESGYLELADYLLVIFLDALILSKRGARDGAETLQQSELVSQSKRVKVNNNLILNKIKIAFSLTTDDIIDILALADFRLSKSELSALFRNPTHRNYRECGNQLIRNFLTGLTAHIQKKSAGNKPKNARPKNAKPRNAKYTKSKSSGESVKSTQKTRAFKNNQKSKEQSKRK
jgi:uncharacterized protein YehS (DUF1456 family)